MKAIYLSSFGPIEEEVFTVLEEYCWQVFGFDIRRTPEYPDPAFAYNQQLRQCSSALLLKEILTRIPSDAVRVLGITNYDLYIPMLSFVFGHAQLNGPAAVISLARLRPAFYQGKENRELFLRRTVKEAVHELGHTFGLIHCQDTECAMSLSNAIQQVDRKHGELCRNCSLIFEESVQHIRRNDG